MRIQRLSGQPGHEIRPDRHICRQIRAINFQRAHRFRQGIQNARCESIGNLPQIVFVFVGFQLLGRGTDQGLQRLPQLVRQRGQLKRRLCGRCLGSIQRNWRGKERHQKQKSQKQAKFFHDVQLSSRRRHFIQIKCGKNREKK